MERVLVTGGLGYIGSSLAPMLLSKGYRLSVLDNLFYLDLRSAQIDRRILAPNFTEGDKYELIRADIRNPAAVRQAMESADVIVHFAAVSGLPVCRSLGEEAREVNVEGTRNILSSLQKGQALIFASTGSVYGKVDAICCEDSKLNPLSLYARTKAEAEGIIKERATIFRFATGFGYAPNLRLELLANCYVEAALSSGEISVYESGAKRTFIHVSDMSRAIMFALEHLDDMAGEVYNVGHESLNCTKLQLALAVQSRVEARTGRRVAIGHIEGHDQDRRDYEVCYEKIRKAGFSPAVSLDEGIDALVERMVGR